NRGEPNVSDLRLYRPQLRFDERRICELRAVSAGLLKNVALRTEVSRLNGSVFRRLLCLCAEGVYRDDRGGCLCFCLTYGFAPWAKLQPFTYALGGCSNAPFRGDSPAFL